MRDIRYQAITSRVEASYYYAAMNARRIGLAATVVAVLASMWLVHLVKVRREARRREAARIEAAEIMQMAAYEQDLRMGMTQQQVEE